jgi:two-component system response regulator AtoC
MQKHTKRLALPSKRIPPEILKILLEYPWKGNARELENCIERAIVLSVGDTIEREALPEAILQPPPLPMRAEISGKTSTDESSLSIKQRSRDLEVDLIQRALKKTGGNRTHAAKVLEISHRALLYKLKEYGIGES